MEKKHTLIVVAFGDGGTDYGHRIAFHDFTTFEGARAAAKAIARMCPDSKTDIITENAR